MQISFPEEWDRTLRQFYILGGCPVPSMRVLIAHVVADKNTLLLAEAGEADLFCFWLCMDNKDTPEIMRFPKQLALTIHASRDFKTAVQQASVEEAFSPSKLRDVYNQIVEDMKSPKTPLAAKIKGLDWVANQEGWGRPKRLEVDNQHTHKGAVLIVHGSTMQIPSDQEVLDANYKEVGEDRALPARTGTPAPEGFGAPSQAGADEPNGGDLVPAEVVG